MPPSKTLRVLLRDQIQVKHYSSHTEEAYAYWVREFILVHKAKSGSFRHPSENASPGRSWHKTLTTGEELDISLCHGLKVAWIPAPRSPGARLVPPEY